MFNDNLWVFVPIDICYMCVLAVIAQLFQNKKKVINFYETKIKIN